MIIGLTGSIATGKSTVANLLTQAGLPVIDADVAARKVVEKGSPTLEEISATFANILLEDGTLNREKLGEIVFNDEKKRLQLNAIMHPAIRQWMKSEQERLLEEGEPIIIVDIPLLFENKLEQTVDQIIVVATSASTQLQRLMQRNHLSVEQAQQRIASQIPIADKVKRADVVIDNEGTLEETKYQVEQWLNNLKKK